MRTIVILVFASILAAPIANIAQTRNGAIVGRVVTADGMPAAEVRVSAMPLPNDKGIASTAAAAAGVTDIEGRYRISDLPAGRYAVLPNIGNDPSLTLRQTYAAPAIVVRPGAETLRDISLEPQGRVTISGRVNQELMPRNARTVSLGSVDKVLQARVATDGSFSFTGVPKGTYRLSLPDATFGWTSKQIHVENEDITDITVTPDDSIRVMGRIVTENGLPVPRFFFSLEGPKGFSLHGYMWTTDTVRSNGMIHVTGWADKPDDVLFHTSLPIGEYRIAVSGLPPGYTLKSFTYGATDLLKEPLKLTGEVRQLAIILTPPAEASGVTVRGKLIRDTTLPQSLSTNRFVLTSPRMLAPLEVPIRRDGSFELADVPPGIYWISEPRLWLSLTVGSRNIAGIEFRTSTMRAAYEEAVRRAALPLAPASTSPSAEPLDPPDPPDPPERERSTSVRESQRVTVSGRVPGASNSPITLEAESSFHKNADEDGRFSFTEVPPGIYRAYTGAFAGTPFPKTVVVGDADVHDLELSPDPARKTIKGRIFVEAGHSIPLIALTVRPNVDSGPPFEHPYTLTSHYSRHGFGLVASDGRFIIDLPEGRHRLRVDVYPDSYRVASVTYGSVNLMKDLLQIDEAEPKEISIKLSTVTNAPWGQVTGRLSGLPNVSPTVRVALLSRSNLQLEAEPKRDGSFEFAKVPPDTYTVLTTPRIAALPPQSIVVTETNPARVAVTIPSQRTLAVRVLSESGSPRSGFGVTLRLTLSKTEAYGITLSVPFLTRTGNETVCIVDVCSSSPQKMFGEPSIKRGDNDGVFALTLPEAEYRIEASVQQGKSLRSLTSGTTNLLDQPLRVGPNTADITITVSD